MQTTNKFFGKYNLSFWKGYIAHLVLIVMLSWSMNLQVFAVFLEKKDWESFITSELTQLAEVKPELIETSREFRGKMIDELKTWETSWSKKNLLERFKEENFEEVRKGWFVDEEKAGEILDNLKKKGGVITLIEKKTRIEKQLDASLFEEGGVLKTKETPYEIEIPKQATAALVIAEDKDSAGEIISAEEDKSLAEDKTPNIKEEIRYFQWNANAVQNIFKDNKSIYKEIWEATDLLVTTKEDGVKEDIILKNSSAPTKFDYIVETVGLKLQTTSDGGLVFLDETGQEKFFVPAPDVTDVTGKKVTEGVRYELGWIDVEEELELREGRGERAENWLTTETGELVIETDSVMSGTGVELEEIEAETDNVVVIKEISTGSVMTDNLALPIGVITETGATASGVMFETVESEETTEIILEEALEIQENSLLESMKEVIKKTILVFKKPSKLNLYASVREIPVENLQSDTQFFEQNSKEVFAKSDLMNEEFNQTEDEAIRRYKLRLILDIESITENQLTLKTGEVLTYPLDIDPTTYVISFEAESNYIQEDVKGPITNWVQDGGTGGHFTDGVNPITIGSGSTASKVVPGVRVRMIWGEDYTILNIIGDGTGSGAVILSAIVGSSLVEGIYGTDLEYGNLVLNDFIDTITEDYKISRPITYLGSALDVSSDWKIALFGSQYNNPDDWDGVVYVYRDSGGTLLEAETLFLNDLEASGYIDFGNAVALSDDGNTAIIGAYRVDVDWAYDSGAAYVFTNSGWVLVQQTKLIPPEPQGGAHFGNAIAISGDGNTVIVGAYRENVNGNRDSGAAYVYTQSEGVWSLKQKLLPSTIYWAYFGENVSVSGDGSKFIVSADWSKTAYVYTNSGGIIIEEAALQIIKVHYPEPFADNVAISGDWKTIAVASFSDTYANIKEAGVVYIYTNLGNVWTQTDKIFSPYPNSRWFFGNSLKFSEDGSSLVVGAMLEEEISEDNGKAYLFKLFNGVVVNKFKLDALNQLYRNYFGAAVTISDDGGTILIGASWSASVYVFKNINNLSTLPKPVWQYYTIITEDQQFKTYQWARINSASLTEDLNGANLWYSVSFDNRKNFKIWTGTQWRTIVSNQNSITGLEEGKWALRDNWDNWILSDINGTNTINSAISQSVEFLNNRMSGTGLTLLNSVDWQANWGFIPNSEIQNTFDMSVTFFNTDQAKIPEVRDISIEASIFPNIPHLDNYHNGNVTNDSTPTLQFDLSHPASEQLRYKLQVDDDFDFSSPKYDYYYTSTIYSSSYKNITYNLSTALPNGHWYWRVKAVNLDGFESDWAIAHNGFIVNTNTFNLEFDNKWTDYQQEDLKGTITNWVQSSWNKGYFTDGINPVPIWVGTTGSKVLKWTSVILWNFSYIISEIKWDWTSLSSVTLEWWFDIKNSIVLGIYGTEIKENKLQTAWYDLKQIKFNASDKSANDYFGTSVDVSADGKIVIVWSPRNTVEGITWAGSVYVYTNSGWELLEKTQLTASDKRYNNQFGNSIAISNDANTIVVSDLSRKAGYIFTNSGWVLTEEVKLFPTDVNSVYFGNAVAISADGKTVAIADNLMKINGVILSGAVYVYTKIGNNWVEEWKLTSSDLFEWKQFGNSIALSGNGNTLVVGVWVDSPNWINRAGSAYVFSRINWAWREDMKILPDYLINSDHFGKTVAISDDAQTILIGTETTVGYGSGYIFKKREGTWAQEARLQPKDTYAGSWSNDYVGRTITLSGDGKTVILGAPYWDWNEISYSGWAYLFTYSENWWKEETSIYANDGIYRNYFSEALAISADAKTLIIGTKEDDPDAFSNAGSAYLIDLKTVLPNNIPFTTITKDKQFNTTNWSEIKWIKINEELNSGLSFYSVSFDNRNEFKIWTGTQWRTIASNKNATTGLEEGKWAYRDNDNLWTLSQNNGVDNANYSISQSLLFTNNQMTGMEIETLTSSNWKALGGFITNSFTQMTFDIAVSILNISDFGKVSIDQVSVEVNRFPYKPIVKNYNQWVVATSNVLNLQFDLNDDDKDVLRYQIQIDNDWDFSSPIVNEQINTLKNAPLINATYTTPILPNGHWYWRIKTIDSNWYESDWSLVEKWFKVNSKSIQNLDFDVENDYLQENIKGPITNWVQKTAVTWYFTDWTSPISLGIGNTANKVVPGVRVEINGVFYNILEILGDGTTEGSVTLSGWSYVFSNNVNAIYGTKLNNSILSLNSLGWNISVFEKAKLTSSDKANYDYFWSSVAVSDNWEKVVIGAFAEDPNGYTDAGSAYVFTNSGWILIEKTKLIASDVGSYDNFGQSVDISADGNTILVGAYKNTVNTSQDWAAYIFINSGGVLTEQVRLVSSRKWTIYFGYSVSISSDGNTAVIGAYRDASSWISELGWAYIFQRSWSVWKEEAFLIASDRAKYDNFGKSVSISGDGNTIIIGADSKTSDNFTQAGSAYIFKRWWDIWIEEAKLMASDQASLEYFGASVSLSFNGDTALIGAPKADTERGSAYVFKKEWDFWREEIQLKITDISYQSEYGASVSLSSDGMKAIVGSHNTYLGSAYLFVKENNLWKKEVKLSPHDGLNHNYFGYSLAMSGDGKMVLIGAIWDTPEGINYGWSSYVFAISDSLEQIIIPESSYYTTITNKSQLSVEKWDSINSVLITEENANNNIFYSVSFDNRNEFKIWTGTEWRRIASNKNRTTGLEEGKWAYRNSLNDWSLAEVIGGNNANSALSQAIWFATNQWDSAQMEALIKENWEVDGGFIFGETLTLDLGVTIYWDGVNIPSVDQVSFSVNQKPNLPKINNYNDGDVTSSGIIFDFDLTDADIDVLKYQIQIDDNVDFSSPVIDILEEGVGISSPRNNVHYTASDLADGFHYYWRVRAIDNLWALSDWAVAENGFIVDATFERITFETENNFTQEDVKGLITNWVQDSDNTGHFTDGIETITVGTGWILTKVLTGVRVEINGIFYDITNIIGDGSGTGGVVLSGNVVSGNVNQIYGTNFSNWDSELNSYIVPDYIVSQTAENKIFASDAELWDYFGNAVSISADGNTALISAYSEDANGLDGSGSVYVFVRLNGIWIEEARLTISDSERYDYLSSSVSLSDDGNTALIGVYTKNNYTGAVYVFTRSNEVWTEQSKLTADDATSWDYFGYSVSLSGDAKTAVIGALWKTVDGFSSAGTVYVFTNSDDIWSQNTKLIVSDAASDDAFGCSVSISRDWNTIIGGAYGKDSYNGTAYVFSNLDGIWTEQAKLTSAVPIEWNAFGETVSISADGNSAIITSSWMGNAYVFTRSGLTWTEEIQLLDLYTIFPISADISDDGNLVVLGDYWSELTYVYKKLEWVWSKIELTPNGNRFGSSVALSGDTKTLLVGAYEDLLNAVSVGSVSVFKIDPPQKIPVINTPYTLTTNLNQIDTSTWWGINSVKGYDTLNWGNVWYSVSFDGRNEFVVWNSSLSAWDVIVSNQASTTWFTDGDWAFRDAGGVWILSTLNGNNAAESGLSQALSYANNQMDSLSMNALTSTGWSALGWFEVTQTTLDFGVTFYLPEGARSSPSVRKIDIDYFAEIVDEDTGWEEGDDTGGDEDDQDEDNDNQDSDDVYTGWGWGGSVSISDVWPCSNTTALYEMPTLQSTSKLNLVRPIGFGQTKGRITRPVELSNCLYNHYVLLKQNTLITDKTGKGFEGTLIPPRETSLPINNQLQTRYRVIKGIEVGAEDRSALTFSENFYFRIYLDKKEVLDPNKTKVYYYNTTNNLYELAGNGGTLSADQTYIEVEVNHMTLFAVLVDTGTTTTGTTPISTSTTSIIPTTTTPTTSTLPLTTSTPPTTTIPVNTTIPTNTETNLNEVIPEEFHEAAEADTDGDGIPDDWETNNGLDFNNPADAIQDADGDGVSNLNEYLVGTNPRDADSDNDGLSDSQELLLGTDSDNFDTDGDGISDGLEVKNGTDPLDPENSKSNDLDGDGMLDSWETANGFNPADPTDAYLDRDSDGLINRDEYERGTNPLDADTDDDGLKDGAEVLIYYTNPLMVDTDGDGIWDGQEIRGGTNPLVVNFLESDRDSNGIDDTWEEQYYQDLPHSQEWYELKDTDNDGLNDYQEYLYGSSPVNQDTDADGLSDYVEVRESSTLPNLKDTDGDDLTDYEEIKIYMTNPNLRDTDGDRYLDGSEIELSSDPLDPNSYPSDQDKDGMPDAWEEKYNLNPQDASDGSTDLDVDGLNNRAEYYYNTNPVLQDTDGDILLDGREVQIGTNPRVHDVDFRDENQNGVDDAWEMQYFNELFSELGGRDYDSDGLSDKLEYDYKTNPTLKDTDGDGLSDSEEIFVYNTDPNNKKSNKRFFAITNLKDNSYLSTDNPLVKGVAPLNTKIKVIFLNTSFKEVAFFETVSNENNIFLGRISQNKNSWTSSLPDGKYYVYAFILNQEGEKLNKTKKILIEIDSTFNLNEPDPTHLSDKSIDLKRILEGVEIRIYDRIPEVRGTTYFGSQVIATWQSLVLTSSLIADNEAGNFTIKTQEPLELGDHYVTLYAITPDGVRSEELILPFEIQDLLHTSASERIWDNFPWTLILWVFYFLIAIFLLFLWYRQKKRKEEESKKEIEEIQKTQFSENTTIK